MINKDNTSCPDIVLRDLVTSDIYEFSLKGCTNQNVYFIPISSYFPFDTNVLDMFDKMSEDEYAIGVGYPKKGDDTRIDDIQVGVSGGAKRYEQYPTAAKRELAEETGIDFDTLVEHSEVVRFTTGSKEWSSYLLSISNKSSLVENIPIYVGDNSSKRGVSMMIKMTYLQYMKLYNNIAHMTCYEDLKSNVDRIRYISIISKRVLQSIKLKLRHTLWQSRIYVPAYLTKINNIPANECSGIYLGHLWAKGKIIPRRSIVSKNKKQIIKVFVPNI